MQRDGSIILVMLAHTAWLLVVTTACLHISQCLNTWLASVELGRHGAGIQGCPGRVWGAAERAGSEGGPTVQPQPGARGPLPPHAGLSSAVLQYASDLSKHLIPLSPDPTLMMLGPCMHSVQLRNSWSCWSLHRL